MFFRSGRAVVLAIILIGVGGFQLVKGLYYREVSRREAATVGILLYVYHGKSSTYDYRYEVNGVAIRDESGSCKTALSPAGCVVGAPVRVYYDRDQVTETLLQEFGAASREKISFGCFMLGGGFLLLVLYPIAKKFLSGPDESPDIDVDTPAVGPEIIHVVPDE